MPYFLITVKFRDRQTIQAIREYPERDIEQVYLKLQYKANEKYGHQLLYFNCVMVSKHTAEVKSFIEEKGRKSGGRTMHER